MQMSVTDVAAAALLALQAYVGKKMGSWDPAGEKWQLLLLLLGLHEPNNGRSCTAAIY